MSLSGFSTESLSIYQGSSLWWGLSPNLWVPNSSWLFKFLTMSIVSKLLFSFAFFSSAFLVLHMPSIGDDQHSSEIYMLTFICSISSSLCFFTLNPCHFDSHELQSLVLLPGKTAAFCSSSMPPTYSCFMVQLVETSLSWIKSKVY